MHTRLHSLASRGSRSELTRRRLQRTNGDNIGTCSWRSLSSTDDSPHVSLVGNSRRNRMRPRPSDWHPHMVARPSAHQQPMSSLHTTSQSLAPPSALLQATGDESSSDNGNGEKELEQDIDLLASSCLSTLLPDQIFYQEGEDSKVKRRDSRSALDKELGLDSVWEDGGDEEYRGNGSAAAEDYDHINSFGSGHSTTNNPQERRKWIQKSAREMLRNFDPQSPPPTMDDPEELQLWLECAAQREAVMKYQTLIDKARDRKAYDSMSLMQRHVVQWYQGLRDSIEIRQKEYLSNEDTRRAKKRYGPFLCSLHPEKMAVILAHEAMSQALLLSGRNGKEGVPLVKMAHAIGSAMETEVISQRRLKERFRGSLDSEPSDDKTDDDGLEGVDSSAGESSSKTTEELAMDRWKFSASHLKIFMDELQRNDPQMKKNKRAINYAMRRAKQAMNTEEGWTNEDLVHLGAALLSILIDNAKVYVDGKEEPAFKVEKRWVGQKKSASYVVFNNNLQKMFTEDEFISWAANTTRHTPMIVPPTDWTGPREGGYRWLEVDLMRTHSSNLQREALQHGDLSQVCDGLNILGRTSWKINQEILNIGQNCWDHSISIGDIPSRTDFDVPTEPLRPDRIPPEVYANTESPVTQAAVAANRSYRESMYKRQRALQKNMDLRSLRCSAMLKLNQAEKFKDFNKIYFPYNLDFRGRAYPVPPHFSNVGSDLCRGMLTFAEPKPLGKKGLYWLKVHLANFAGKDKMSFEDRAQYVEDNMDEVRQSVEDPFSDDPWWMSLDDPFQGLATCQEIIRAVDSGDPESYRCSLPVHMDGSCNGLQHYAALGRDTIGGKAVNLLEGDGPQDVYIEVMHEVIRRVAEESERDVEFDTSNLESLGRQQKKALKNNQAAKLVNGLIDRGVVKRTVMTSVYGVTYIGARQQIQEKIEEKLEEKGFDLDEMDREIFAAAGYLATVTMEVMGDLFQGARNTKSWLADCARLISQQGHPVAWISPIGIPAVQPYRQRRPRTVVTVMQSVTVTDENDDLPVHKSRQCTAFPPNYVHSLDSSHMLMTAMEMDRRGLAFSAVHDSFWTHACDIDEMNEALRDCFIELYSQPLLADLKESWELRYPEVEFPELPDLGELDLNEVKSATYFFQ